MIILSESTTICPARHLGPDFPILSSFAMDTDGKFIFKSNYGDLLFNNCPICGFTHKETSNNVETCACRKTDNLLVVMPTNFTRGSHGYIELHHLGAIIMIYHCLFCGGKLNQESAQKIVATIDTRS